MEKINPVQQYVKQINSVTIPYGEADIFDFLTHLSDTNQKGYLSFILSQSHIFDAFQEIIRAYNHIRFNDAAGFYRNGKDVPRVNKDGKIIYESSDVQPPIDEKCRNIINSLQGEDRSQWDSFVRYVKSIYEPQKMNIHGNPILSQFNNEVQTDFWSFNNEYRESCEAEIQYDELSNKPVPQAEGLFGKFKELIAKSRKKKELEKITSKIKDDEYFYKKMKSLIEKYKEDEKSPAIFKSDLSLVEKLVDAGIPIEQLLDLSFRPTKKC